MKLIIAGSRNFYDYTLLKSKLDYYLRNVQEEIEVVSGAAKGADSLGEQYAKEKGYPIKQFPADWSLGKRAGYLRNFQMSEYATHCICFWDGESPGTKLMIELCKLKGIVLRIVLI